jgi:hypothetical protein
MIRWALFWNSCETTYYLLLIGLLFECSPGGSGSCRIFFQEFCLDCSNGDKYLYTS